MVLKKFKWKKFLKDSVIFMTSPIWFPILFVICIIYYIIGGAIEAFGRAYIEGWKPDTFFD